MIMLWAYGAYSQVITIDSELADWQDIPVFEDVPGDGGALDLLDMSVTNDDDYLYIRIRTAQEVSLLNEDYTDTEIRIYIDTDNNSETGWEGNGLGSEIGVFCGEREVRFDLAYESWTGSLYDIGFERAPTVTGNEFEIAIDRSAMPDDEPLFQSETINMYILAPGSDFMPDQGSHYQYVFSSGPHPPYQALNLDKASPEHLRIAAYNMLDGGITDPARTESFERIIKALNPDIIGFTEVTIDQADIKDLMDTWVPVSGGWHVEQIWTNVIASRYPIISNELVWESFSRSMATLIDLPSDQFDTDIMILTVHTSCCNQDSDRQHQVDQIARFILDAKETGGDITLPANTPFAMIGDFNLVGYQQQLETLITGDIQNTFLYGEGGPLDWDNGDLDNALCLHSHKAIWNTWRNGFSSYAPGKLDFIFYSGSVMEEMHSYTLDTESMPQDALEMYGLNQEDCGIASDHLPIVADFSLDNTTGTTQIRQKQIHIYPNPASNTLYVECESSGHFFLYDLSGHMVMAGLFDIGINRVDTRNLPAGIYLLLEANSNSPIRVAITH